MNRSAQEIKARCSCILGDGRIVSIVGASSSPTAAYEMVFSETKDVPIAKAGRWLAVLRRDYPGEYHELIQPTLSHVDHDKAQIEEEM